MQESFPKFPFQSTSTDLFEFGGHHFLIYVDRYSGWPQVAQFKTCPNTRQVVTTLKGFFANHGIPCTIRSDAGPQFRSSEFSEFCRQYEVEHITSSAHYPQSNGHAEACVKAMKELTKKYWKRNQVDQKGFDLAILEWRNTPRENGLSPAEWLFGRSLRAMLPIHPKTLKRIDNEGIRKAELDHIHKLESSSITSNQRAHVLDPLSIGTTVRIQDYKSGEWNQIGKIEAVRKNKRSYIVSSNGKEYLRNRQFLKPFKSDVSRDLDASLLDVSPDPIKNKKDIRYSKRVRHSPERYGFSCSQNNVTLTWDGGIVPFFLHFGI